MMHSFLLIGQSNMAGRGFPSEVEPIENKNLYVLRGGRWWPMFVPVHCDRVTAGICLAESFADRYAREHDVKVGLIPCADGGSSIDMWKVGGTLFDYACYMAEIASRTSTIAGVLWHQGESDCYEERYPLYEEKLSVIMNAFRKKLGLYDVPFLLGGLGEYLEFCPYSEVFKNYVHINKSLQNFAKNTDMTAYVPADGLKSNPDYLHFSAEALREFGVRYYDEFKKIEDKNKVFEEKCTVDQAIRNSIESL